MATYPIRQITDKQRLMGCILLFKPKGANTYIKIGPADSVEFTPTVTEVESWSNEFGDRRLIGTFPTQKDGTVAIAGIQMWTEFLYQSLFMSDKTYRVQAAVTAATLTIEGVEAENVVRIPVMNATTVTVSDGNEHDYVEDLDFIFHPSTGFVEILQVPVGAGADAVVTYSAPAITVDDKILDLEIMKASGVRGELSVTGVISDDDNGQPVEMILPDVKFTPNGAVAMGDTAALNVGGLTGKVYATSDRGYGSLRAFAKIA